MLAEQVLTNGLETPANLKYIVEKYCGVILDKTERNNLIRRGFTYDTIVYGAKDIEYLEKVMILQTQDALKKDVLLAIKLENEFVKALAYTEYCGLFLDIEKWRTKYQSAGLVLEEVEKELDIWIINSPYKHYIDTQLDFFTQYVEGKPIFTKTLINWSSSQQVKELFKEIGIKVIDTSNKGKSGESISKNILEMQKNAFDIIPIYLKYQNIKKDFSTYGESFLKYINPVTGRIHCEFNQLMSTGRLSSTKPNLQNLPSDERTRSCFVAEEGNILVDADYSA
jgi:DNA polymerase I-like protein with 3'-5' exonuclease and polymerase domains